MSLTACERETIVRWSDDAEEPLTLYTHKEKAAHKLIKAGGKLKTVSKIDGKIVSWTVECPREWFKWPRKAARKVMTGEQRLAAGERLKRAREAR